MISSLTKKILKSGVNFNLEVAEHPDSTYRKKN